MHKLLRIANPLDRTGGYAAPHAAVAALVGVILALSGVFAVHHFLAPKERGGARPTRPSAPVIHIKAGGGPQPASWSLARYAPWINNQGNSESCGGQSTSTLAEIYANERYQRRHDQLGRIRMSPGFIWNQVNGGCDCPVSFEQAFGILTGQGDDTHPQFPYDGLATDYWYLPSGHQKAEAGLYKAAYWRTIAAGDFYTMESEIHGGRGLVMLMPVYWSFLNSWQLPAGSVISGQSGAWQFYHFVTLVGYNHTGPIIQNSWGSQWGNGGRVQVTWSFIAHNAKGIAVAIFPKLPPQWHPFPLNLFQSWERSHHKHLTSPYDRTHRLTWPASIFAHHTYLGGYRSSAWHPGHPGYTEYTYARGRVYAFPKTGRYKIVWNTR